MDATKAALVLVDLQNDFCPGGKLAVKEGDQACHTANRVLPRFEFVVASQDWHPANHCSFTGHGGTAPPHCIQKTRGAELHTDIDPQAVDVFIRKADTATQEAYSSFEGHDPTGRPLHEILKARGVTTLYIAGLATDYGVRATVLDALQLGYQVFVITDAVRAVNVKTGDGDRALKEMKARGAKLITSKTLVE